MCEFWLDVREVILVRISKQPAYLKISTSVTKDGVAVPKNILNHFISKKHAFSVELWNENIMRVFAKVKGGCYCFRIFWNLGVFFTVNQLLHNKKCRSKSTVFWVFNFSVNYLDLQPLRFLSSHRFFSKTDFECWLEDTKLFKLANNSCIVYDVIVCYFLRNKNSKLCNNFHYFQPKMSDFSLWKFSW